MYYILYYITMLIRVYRDKYKVLHYYVHVRYKHYLHIYYQSTYILYFGGKYLRCMQAVIILLTSVFVV